MKLYYRVEQFESIYAINFGQGKVSILKASGEHHGICSHQGEVQSTKELAGYLSLFRPLAPCQSRCQLLHLCSCPRVKSTKCFQRLL